VRCHRYPSVSTACVHISAYGAIAMEMEKGGKLICQLVVGCQIRPEYEQSRVRIVRDTNSTDTVQNPRIWSDYKMMILKYIKLFVTKAIGRNCSQY